MIATLRGMSHSPLQHAALGCELTAWTSLPLRVVWSRHGTRAAPRARLPAWTISASSLTDPCYSWFLHAGHAASEALHGVGHFTSEAASGAGHAASQGAEAVGHGASAVYEGVCDTASGAVHGAGDLASKATGAVKDTVSGAGEAVSKK